MYLLCMSSLSRWINIRHLIPFSMILLDDPNYNLCISRLQLTSFHYQLVWIGLYLSQLISYIRACAFYQNFIDKVLQLTIKLLSQGFFRERLESSLRKFFGRHHDLVDRYEISISQMTMDIFRLS